MAAGESVEGGVEAGCMGERKEPWGPDEAMWNPGTRRRGVRGELQGPCNHCFATGRRLCLHNHHCTEQHQAVLVIVVGATAFLCRLQVLCCRSPHFHCLCHCCGHTCQQHKGTVLAPDLLVFNDVLLCRCAARKCGPAFFLFRSYFAGVDPSCDPC